jgi:predicted Kef-type K+ transport protein
MKLLIKFNSGWYFSLKTMFKKKYWNLANTIEFFAFVIKALIIIPGLLFDTNIWWLYIFALISSLSLIWSSTVKTLPALIWFNILWSILACTYILKHFGIIL